MKKAYLYITLITLISYTTNAIAQATAPMVQHSNLYGGTHDEYPAAILQDHDSSFLIGGHTASSNGDVTHYRGGSHDGWLVKVDSQGNFLWGKTIGGSDDDYVNTIAIAPHAYIAGGMSFSRDGDMDTIPHPAGSGEFGFLAWIDPATGSLKRIRSYSGDLSGNIRDIKVLSNGNMLLLSQMGVSTNAQSIWLTMIDSTGNILWNKPYGGTVRLKSDNPFSITIKKSGGFLLSAQVVASSGQVYGVHDTFGRGDIWIADINDTGKFIWGKCYGGSFNENPIGVYETSTGNILCIAATASFDGDLTSTGRSVYDETWAFETNDTGKILWSKCYGGEFPMGMHGTCDDGAIIGGFNPYPDSDLYSIRVIRINSSGDSVWTHNYGSLDLDCDGFITTTRDNGYAFAAAADTVHRDVKGTLHGGYDLWFAKLAPDDLSNYCQQGNSNAVKWMNDTSNLQVYPNPVNDNLYIKNAAQGTTLCIYNIIGQQLAHYTLNSQLQIISLQQLPEGSYLLQFTDRNGNRTNKKIVKH